MYIHTYITRIQENGTDVTVFCFCTRCHTAKHFPANANAKPLLGIAQLVCFHVSSLALMLVSLLVTYSILPSVMRQIYRLTLHTVRNVYWTIPNYAVITSNRCSRLPERQVIIDWTYANILASVLRTWSRTHDVSIIGRPLYVLTSRRWLFCNRNVKVKHVYTSIYCLNMHLS